MAEKYDEQRDKLVEAYISAADEEKRFDSPKIKEITRIILENQVNHFCETKGYTTEQITKSLLNENGVLNEVGTPGSTIAVADIAQFGEIYLPIAAKVIPSLVINNMVGVQPMTQPNGFVYAMRAFHTRSPYDEAQDAGNVYAARGATYSKLQIITVADATNITANTNWIQTATDGTNVADAFVLYKEGNNLLVKTNYGTTGYNRYFVAGDSIDTNTQAAQAYAAEETTVTAVYTPEIAQAAGIFKYYSGYGGSAAATTDQGQYQQNVGQVQIRVERTAVTAKTRQLFAEYPIEAEQDLRAIHKRDLRAELSEITAGEIVNEINKEFIDDINTAAAAGGNTTFDMETADARWEIEKYRSLWVRVTRAANQIAQDTRLGPGNYIIASPDVCTALSQLDGFAAAPAQGTFGSISRIGGDWYVGRIGGTMDLYRDMFATSDYISVGRKGANEWDAGTFFLPYVPLQFIAGQTQENLQPKMKFMTRYGKVANVLQTDNTVADKRYYRKITVQNLFTAL